MEPRPQSREKPRLAGVPDRVAGRVRTESDLQALERRLALKRRDGDVDHVVLLVADTRRNRRALAGTPAGLAGLPIRTRDILAPLRDGRDPGASGIVIL